MKNVCLILWIMVMTSTWWGFGILCYQGVKECPAWFGLPFILVILGSILTLIFIGMEVVAACHKSWDGF